MVSLDLKTKIMDGKVKGSVPSTSKRDIARIKSSPVIDEAVE